LSTLRLGCVHDVPYSAAHPAFRVQSIGYRVSDAHPQFFAPPPVGSLQLAAGIFIRRNIFYISITSTRRFFMIIIENEGMVIYYVILATYKAGLAKLHGTAGKVQ